VEQTVYIISMNRGITQTQKEAKGGSGGEQLACPPKPEAPAFPPAAGLQVGQPQRQVRVDRLLLSFGW
jgi:hypothetical protein